MSSTAQTQQKQTKSCPNATNAAEALEAFDWMEAKVDTMQTKQDSLYWAEFEERLLKMKTEQQKREVEKRKKKYSF